MRAMPRALLLLLVLVVVLGAALAVRIYTWGRPLLVVYRPIEIVVADAQTGRSVTYLRMDSDNPGPRRYETVDTNNDGTVDIILHEHAARSFSRPTADDPETRWLILCLDGVPFEEMAQLWRAGYFREFFAPVPLIAPFPTASGVALSEAFHTAPVQGYEDGFFDIKRNRLSGGALTTTTGESIPYLSLLDYDLPGYLKGLAYTLPHRSYRADLGRFRQRFLASREKVFVAHIASSDSLYHILPAAEMRTLLTELDALLRELYFDAGGKLRITLFSDHGNSLTQSRPVSLAAHLATGGWRLAKQCGPPGDLVAPAYGLLGFFSLYCVGGRKAELAAHLARLDGVDLVLFAEADGVFVESSRGRARFTWTEDGAVFRYQALSGDPLGLAEILGQLRRDGTVDAEGWVRDVDLSAATEDHIYPDPAYRLWRWAHNHVVNPADVVVSLKPGWHFGSATFERIVTLRSTHGSFDRGQTLGFATGTDGRLDGPLRSADLLPENLPVRKETVKEGSGQQARARVD